MNLIDRWKNRETKKKLREENIKLRDQLKTQFKTQYPIVTVDQNIHIHQVAAIHRISGYEEGIIYPYGEEIVKECVNRLLMQDLGNFIQYDFKSNGFGGMDCIGTLYVAVALGDRDND